MKIGDKATVFDGCDPVRVVLIVSGNRRLKDENGNEWQRNRDGRWVGYAGTSGSLGAYVEGDEERAERACEMRLADRLSTNLPYDLREMPRKIEAAKRSRDGAAAHLATIEADLSRLEARAAELPGEIEDANRRLANARAAVMSDRAMRKAPPEGT